MPSAEEQDAQFTEGDVERRLAELERKISLLDESGLDRLTQSGYLQFDGIPFRWDGHGMQIVASGGVPVSPIWFVNALAADPYNETVFAQVAGEITDSGTAPSVYMWAENTVGHAFIGPRVDSSDTATLEAQVVADATGTLNWTMAQSASFANWAWTNTFITLGELASTPSPLVDGSLWYEGDKLYARINGVTVQLGASVQRVYVNTDAWDQDVGTNYLASMDGGVPTGWNTVGMTATASGSTGDIDSLADIDPAYLRADGAGDYAISDAVFGGYEHTSAVTLITGTAPVTLNIQFLGRATGGTVDVVAGDGFGLWSDVTAPTSAAAVAVIRRETNWTLYRGNDVATDTSIGAVDANWHVFKMTITLATSVCEWFIDGVSQGTITLTTDVWPVGFGSNIVNTSAATTVDLSHSAVWYE